MKKHLKWLIKCGFTITLFILIFKPSLLGITRQFIPVTLGDLWKEITTITLSTFWTWIAIAILIQALGMFCSMLRWNLLLKGQGIKFYFTHLAVTYLTGRFFGMFLPGTLGLDGYRLFYVGKQTSKWVESTAVIIIEKIIGFIALTFLVLVTLPLGCRLFHFKPLVLSIILVVLGCMVLSALILLFNPRLMRTLIGIIPLPGRSRIEGKLKKISHATTIYGGQRMLLVKATLLGVMVHLCTCLMYFGTAMSIRSPHIDIFDILFASPLMIYGTVLGPSIGGEGIREIVFALILGAKTGHAKAILFSHLGFWIGGVLGMIGGVIYLMRPAAYQAQIAQMKTMQEKMAREEDEDLKEAEFKKAREKITHRLTLCPAAGLLAGSLVGLMEAVVITLKNPRLEEYTILYYSILSYGILGLILGVGLGILGGLLSIKKRGADAYSTIATFYCSSVFFSLAFIISRFIIVRDFLNEKPMNVLQHLLLLFTVLAISIALYYSLKLILKKKNLGSTIVSLLTAWLLLLLAGVGASTLRTPTHPFPPTLPPISESLKEKPNVILIMVDTLRADHLPCYGYRDNVTPAINRFASDGVRYENAFAQSSWTKPQVATLLTSLYPSTHNTYLKPHLLPDEVETLPEIMKDLGYYTCGIANIVHLSPSFNFNQGFDRYRYLAPDFFFFARESSSKLSLYNGLRLIRERFFSQKKQVNHYYQDGKVVNQLAFKWLSACTSSRFLLFLHYMEPHDPYFAHPYNGAAVARVSTPNPDPSQADPMRKLYDGEISYLDQCLDELIEYLKREGLYENTLIILTADHGEEFYEHSGWWHGNTLYDEQIHIPLIIKYPQGRFKGTLVKEMVRTLDIAPTILDYVSSQIPPAMQGKSLLHNYQLRPPQDQVIFSEENLEYNVLKSLRSEQWKLILANQDNPRGLAPQELYQVKHDPGEKENVAAREVTTVHQIAAQIDHYVAYAMSSAARETRGNIDRTTEERLRALGYVR